MVLNFAKEKIVQIIKSPNIWDQIFIIFVLITIIGIGVFVIVCILNVAPWLFAAIPIIYMIGYIAILAWKHYV